MSFINCRFAQPEEGPYLSELSLRSKSFWPYSADYLQRCRPYLTIDEDYIKKWTVVVIEEITEKQPHIVGYYSLKIVAGENRLDNLWIDLPHIGKGFGRFGLKHALAQAQRINWDHFYLASEPQAVAFYQKYGGVLVGFVPSKLDKNLRLPHIKFTLSD